MLEVMLTALFVAAALAVVGAKNGASSLATSNPSSDVRVLIDDDDVDLPCPWCAAATHESDRHCPSCGQPFG